MSLLLCNLFVRYAFPMITLLPARDFFCLTCKHLGLYFLPELQDAAMANLSKAAPNLIQLDFTSNVGLTDGCMEYIGRLTNLVVYLSIDPFSVISISLSLTVPRLDGM